MAWAYRLLIYPGFRYGRQDHRRSSVRSVATAGLQSDLLVVVIGVGEINVVEAGKWQLLGNKNQIHLEVGSDQSLKPGGILSIFGV
jgi:hypothetical protein